jgi:hypothetical protein
MKVVAAECRVGQAQRSPTMRSLRLLVGLRYACPTLR